MFSSLAPLLLVPAFLGVCLACVLITFYAERKLSAFIQDRLGPMEVGKFGLLQPVADLLKLLQKEDIIPSKAEKFLFILAPLLIFTAIFIGFSEVPLLPFIANNGSELGLLFIIAIISLDIIGLLLAGVSSKSKFSLLGALRAVAQLVSYEVPLGLLIIVCAIYYQSLDLYTITELQGLNSPTAWFQGGGIFSWFIFQYPIGVLLFVAFYIITLAECNRAPFDLPEGESELVGGFHTEYSGFRFALFFLAEYSMMVLLSMLASILFLGGGYSPFPNIGSVELANYTNGIYWAPFWLILKTVILCLLQVVIRWTYPRLRVDQLMALCWKYLVPFGLFALLFTALWKVFIS